MNRHTTNDGGTAFPCHGPSGQVFQYGMTLRDYFAGQTLAALLIPSIGELYPDDFARVAYEMADAMLAAREGKEAS